MLGLLFRIWTNAKPAEQEQDDPPPPYPVAVTREEVLAHVDHIEAQLKLRYEYFRRRPHCIDIYILCMLSDMEDVKRLCTDANAEEFDNKLIPILPHLSELETLTFTRCVWVNEHQLSLSVDYTRKLWLDVLDKIVSYDPETKASPNTRKGTVYGLDLKSRTYRSQGGGEQGAWEPRNHDIEQLWPTSIFGRKVCRCPVNCAVRPYHSWPHLSPLAKKHK